MANSEIQNYLNRLRASLAGRLPAEKVEEIVAESNSHLHDLVEDYARDPESAFEGKAVAKFGSPEKMAKKLLRELQVLPTQWQAARGPLIVLAIVFALDLGLSYAMDRHVGPYPVNWPVDPDMTFKLLRALSVLFIYLCFRGRRFLFKPLLAYGVVSYAVWLGFTTWNYTPVIDQAGGYVGILNGDLPEYQAQTGQRIFVLNDKIAKLREGARLFAGKEQPVPSIYGFPDGYDTPAGVAYFWETSTFWKFPPEPAFATQEEDGGRRCNWSMAQAAWADVGPYLAEANRRIEVERHTAEHIAQAKAESIFARAAHYAPRFALLTARQLLIVFYMNLIGWALAQIYIRLVWPRRRFAR